MTKTHPSLHLTIRTLSVTRVIKSHKINKNPNLRKFSIIVSSYGKKCSILSRQNTLLWSKKSSEKSNKPNKSCKILTSYPKVKKKNKELPHLINNCKSLIKNINLSNNRRKMNLNLSHFTLSSKSSKSKTLTKSSKRPKYQRIPSK